MPASVLTAAPPATGGGRVRLWSLSTRSRAVLAVGSGLVCAAAFAPLGWALAAPVAVAGLTLSCRMVAPSAGAGFGLLFGAAFFLPLLHWSATLVGAPPWLLLSASQAAFCAALGAGLALVSRLLLWPLEMACLWVAEEALRDRMPFGGFPWGRLAFSQPGTPYARFASLGGAPLVTFAVALTGTLLAAAVVVVVAAVMAPAAGRSRRGWLVVGAVLLIPALGMAIPTPTAGQSSGGPPAATVAIVQGNVPRNGLTGDAEDRAVLRLHVAETERLARQVRAGQTPRPDLVLWPENSSDLDPFLDSQARVLIDQAVRAVGVPVLVGAVLDAGTHVRNSGIVWNPVTGPGEVYDKRHPVPFAEYIPLRGLARAISTKVDLVPRDFVAGRKPGVLHLGPARIGDLICFEVAEDGLVRDAVVHGGRVLVVQTNNATFGHSPETEQQLAMSRLRAVEHGRAVLIAATSGVSAIIGPDGVVRQRSPLFAPAALVARVPLRDGRTLADTLGAGPEWVLGGLGVLAAGLAGGRRLAQRRRRQESPQ